MCVPGLQDGIACSPLLLCTLSLPRAPLCSRGSRFRPCTCADWCRARGRLAAACAVRGMGWGVGFRGTSVLHSASVPVLARLADARCAPWRAPLPVWPGRLCATVRCKACAQHPTVDAEPLPRRRRHSCWILLFKGQRPLALAGLSRGDDLRSLDCPRARSDTARPMLGRLLVLGRTVLQRALQHPQV